MFVPLLLVKSFSFLTQHLRFPCLQNWTAMSHAYSIGCTSSSVSSVKTVLSTADSLVR